MKIKAAEIQYIIHSQDLQLYRLRQCWFQGVTFPPEQWNAFPLEINNVSLPFRSHRNPFWRKVSEFNTGLRRKFILLYPKMITKIWIFLLLMMIYSVFTTMIYSSNSQPMGGSKHLVSHRTIEVWQIKNILFHLIVKNTLFCNHNYHESY